MDQHDDDPDREAIQARRRRFIAVALTTVAAGASACTPRPCLNIASPDEVPSGDPSDGTAPPTSDASAGDVTANDASAGDASAGDASAGDASAGDGGETPPEEPPPHPCLRVAAPPR